MSSDQKSTPHVFAFIGRDDFSIAEKIRAWLKAFGEKHGANGIVLIDCASANDASVRLKTALQGSGLFQARTLVVVKNVWTAKGADTQSLLCEKIESLPHTHFLVMADASMDGRTGLAKTLAQMHKIGTASIELFEIPAGGSLRAWIRSRARHLGGAFEATAENYFTGAYANASEAAGESETYSFNLWHLDNEIRKLVCHAGGKTITRDDIARVSSLPSSAHIFHLTDTLLEKKYGAALRIAYDLIGADPSHPQKQLLSLISFLISQFHSFVVLKSMEDDNMNERDSARNLDWNTKRVWVVSKKIHRHSCESLKKNLTDMLDFERILKTGAGDPILHLDLLIRSVTH